MTSPETEFVSILGSSDKPEALAHISSRSLPENLPILGMSDIVIFPGAVVPLLVETGPSLRLIDDIVAGDRLLAAVLQRKQAKKGHAGHIFIWRENSKHTALFVRVIVIQ